MNDALYNALYIECTVFQWVYFTPYGIVKGRVSRDDWYMNGKKINPTYKSFVGL